MIKSNCDRHDHPLHHSSKVTKYFSEDEAVPERPMLSYQIGMCAPRAIACLRCMISRLFIVYHIHDPDLPPSLLTTMSGRGPGTIMVIKKWGSEVHGEPGQVAGASYKLTPAIPGRELMSPYPSRLLSKPSDLENMPYVAGALPSPVQRPATRHRSRSELLGPSRSLTLLFWYVLELT
jgi:hypothetical protein